MTDCQHPNLHILTDEERKENEGRIINTFNAAFPGYPLDELLQAAYSPIFEFGYCDDCHEMLVRMA